MRPCALADAIQTSESHWIASLALAMKKTSTFNAA
jgi:hypothetical protein